MPSILFPSIDWTRNNSSHLEQYLIVFSLIDSLEFNAATPPLYSGINRLIICSYRAEMENYVTSNNILSGSKWVQLSSFNDTELEELVKAHMKEGMVECTES